MKRYIYNSLPLLLLLFLLGSNSTALHATHNRAGEITVEQIDPLTIKATITTYTVTSSTQADRDSLTLCWGDGTCDVLVRINGSTVNGVPNGEILANNTKKNIYMSFHVYPGLGTFSLSMTDPNRNAGIINVNPPNSDMIEFHLQTTYTLLNPQFEGMNNTPQLLQPPIDIGCVGQPFIHNPNAYDVDGDSLSYHLIVPLRGIDDESGAVVQVPNYIFPEMIIPGAGNIHELDPITGEFLWRAPQRAGEYNIAMIIVEYRQGIPIDTIIRDMQILIEECDNQPPEIEVIEEICVIAGDVLELDIVVTDPDMPLQQVDLTALGGPFQVAQSPAVLQVPTGYQPQELRGRFVWATTCEHISEQTYSVVFRSSDDFPIVSRGGDNSFLSTLKTVLIKVVGPPPEDVLAVAEEEVIQVSWESPYFCEDAADDYFNGFSVWRRIGSNQFPIDTCETGGLAAKGYTKLTIGNITDMQDGRFIFTDTEVERGRTYCYRIIANFARTSAAGFPFNLVESLPSDEICVQLDREVPLITNVDVQETAANTGRIEVRWSKPVASDLDTLIFGGPYRYQVFRSTGFTMDFVPIPGADFTSATFAEANDTVFVDTGLNTIDNPYTYQVAFHVNGESEPLGLTNAAASIFLSSTPTDRANQLSWEEQVPWDNFEYEVFRQNAQGGFDAVGVTTETNFVDTGLENGVEYCYRIQSRGTYGLDANAAPLLNFSQEICDTPGDDVPPCPPTLMVFNICDDATDQTLEEDLFNLLNWTNPNDICVDVDDTESYRVYYTETEGGTLALIEMFDGATTTSFEHQPAIGIAGCYAVTALDFNGNESAFSNIICVDNCPFYELPNTFTPNTDGTNDLFIPFPYRFIDRIEFQVFNRWGGLVFETTDPDINWDGTNLSNEPLKEGVYFYTCRVYEARVTGVVPQETILNGAIHLILGE